MPNKRVTENQRYNAERKVQAALIKRDVDRDAILTQLYQESFNRLQAEIDRFYIAYAGKEGLTKQEAMKKASEFDVTKFAEKAKKAVKEKDFSPGTNSWLRTYNLKMKVSRLELLKAELALEIQNLTSEVNEVFDKARREEYLSEYKRQAGILGISSKGANKRIQSVLGADFYGQNFSSRVWGSTGLQATLQRDVFASLNRVYTDMMGYKQEINRLSKKYGTSKENAKRLLKTEIARINADTQHAMLKTNGFTHMIFVAEPGACDICGPLDKKAIPIDEVEKGVNMFPMHPNCRCSAYGHIKMNYKAGGSTLDREAPNGVWGEDDATKSPLKQLSGVRRYIQYHAYNSVKNEWLTRADSSKAKVSDQLFWEHNGTRYEVDNKNVIFKPTRREKEVGKLLADTLGSHVVHVPEVHNPNFIKTPDYLIDGVRWDLKEIEKTGKNNIDNAIAGKKEQARSFIIDVSKTLMDIDEAYSKIDRIYFNRHRNWVENIILIKGDQIIDIFKRK